MKSMPTNNNSNSICKGLIMAKRNDPKPKARAVGGLAGLSKARAEANKRIKAMTPAQRKAYQAENKKNAVKVALVAAGMIPAGRAAKVVTGGVRNAQRLAGLKSDNRLQRQTRGLTGKVKIEKGLSKMEKALRNSVPPKRTTPASQPSSKLIQNIGRQSALRKKFPDKFKP
jgi:hypothetical protein